MTVTVNTGIINDSMMTIDALARWSGLPTRTLREYRTLGLLPPPIRRGRQGYYDDSHRRRLVLIRRLAERGYSLAGIADLLAAWADGRSLLGVFESAGALGDPTPDEAALDSALGESLLGPMDERARLYTPDVLADLLSIEVASLDAVLASGRLARPYGERWIARSPALVALVAELAAAVGLPAAIEAAEQLDRALEDAGRGAAAALQVGRPARRVDPDATTRLMRRARPLVAQAAASLVVHHLGEVLLADPALAPLVAQIRVGATTWGAGDRA